MWLIVTVLPAPEGPSRTVISPGRDAQVDAVQDLLGPEALDDAGELDRGDRAAPQPTQPP